MLVSLTVGKVDAGVAVLLTEDKRLVRLRSCAVHTHDPATICHQYAPILALARAANDTAQQKLTKSKDRVSFHPPPTLDYLRLNSRHNSRRKPSSRTESPGLIRSPPRTHPQQVWPRISDPTKSPPPRRNTNLPRSRMGPHPTRDVESQIPLLIQEW